MLIPNSTVASSTETTRMMPRRIRAGMNSRRGSSRYRVSVSFGSDRSALRRCDSRISAVKAAWTVPT